MARLGIRRATRPVARRKHVRFPFVSLLPVLPGALALSHAGALNPQEAAANPNITAPAIVSSAGVLTSSAPADLVTMTGAVTATLAKNLYPFIVVIIGGGSPDNEVDVPLSAAALTTSVGTVQAVQSLQHPIGVSSTTKTGSFAPFMHASALASAAGTLAASTAGGSQIFSIFTTQTPDEPNNTDGVGVNYELGTKFTVGFNGTATAIRFWKAAGESGTHTGHLWSSTGTLLASVVFSGETASGWQQQVLAPAVALTSGVSYVVSVNTGNAFYAATTGGLVSQIIDGPLSTVLANNGVFITTPGSFPTGSFGSSNYFRDLVFSAPGYVPPPPVVTGATFNIQIPATNGQAVGTVTATNIPTSWAITAGNASGFFAIDSSGNVTVTAAGAAGLTAQTFALTVQATNVGGSGSASVSIVAHLAVPAVIGATFQLAIPATVNQVAGTVTATNNPTSWTITAGNAAGFFAISNAGVITVTATGAGGVVSQVYGLTVQATNALGSGTGAININATNDPFAAVDGSQNAPSGVAPQLPTLLNGYQLSRRPPWQVAGVHYGVGYPVGTVLKNPASISLAGVTVNTGGRIVTITGSNITLDGYDFSLGGGWAVYVQAPNARIVNSNFFWAAGNTFNSLIWSNGAATNLYIGYCIIDGNGLNLGFGSNIIWNGVDLTIEYCWIKNGGGDCIQVSAGGSVTLRFNLLQQFGTFPGAHGDLLQCTFGPYVASIHFNTTVQPIPFTQGFMLEPDIGPTLGVVTSADIGNNTMIASGSGAMNYFVAVTVPDLVGTYTCHDNYFDDTGAFGFAPGDPRGGPGDSSAKTVFTNNVNMVTGVIEQD